MLIVILYFIIEPLFNASTTLLSLNYIAIYNKKKLFLYSLIFGVLYDVAYTNSIFINTISFLIVSFILELFYKYFKINNINFLIVSFISLILYKLSNYFLLVLFGLIHYNKVILYRGLIQNIYFSILFDIILIIVFKVCNRRKREYIR